MSLIELCCNDSASQFLKDVERRITHEDRDYGKAPTVNVDLTAALWERYVIVYNDEPIPDNTFYDNPLIDAIANCFGMHDGSDEDYEDPEEELLQAISEYKN